MRHRTVTAIVVAFAVLALAACNGKAILVEERTGDSVAASGASTGELKGSSRGDLLAKGGSGLRLGEDGEGGGPGSSTSGGDPKCATTSNPEEGFTADSLTLGTIIPLTGALRPLGEQTARVMKVAVEQTMNRQDSIGGAYSDLNWGCSERPGIFGRRIELKIFSMQNNTPEEALAGMRRLIDVENVFLVRDCYLESNLIGPATQYQNQKGVPAIWCYYSEMPLPALAPWNFSPGTDPQVAAAINAAYAFKKMNKQRAAIVADPTQKDILVPVIKRVAAHFDHPIPNDCIVYKKSQEASNGMRSEVTRIRTCYGAGQTPDLVVALDALNGVFAAMEAESQGWRGAANDVHWTCTGLSCWITSLADLCGNACEGMTTNCASLPCVPWASPKEFPAVERLEDTRSRYLSREPRDILTYAPVAITGGIALWLTMTGPELSRDKFAHTLENLKDWNAGIGPILNTNEADHFGGKSTWVIKFTGRSPWFDDVTGGFLTLDDVGVPESVVRG